MHQNLVRRAIAPFGSHARGGPGGSIYVYRNVVDMRHPVQFNRPTDKKPEGDIFPAQLAWLVHNADHIIHMEDVYFYHNTTLTQMGHVFGSYTAGMPFASHPSSRRRVFNNLCVYFGGAKRYPVAWGYKQTDGNVVLDGNLHWHSDPDVKIPPKYFDTSRSHPLSESNKKHYKDGWDAHSVIGDPRFVAFSQDRHKGVDLRLKPDSPAVKAGVVLPKEWLDPLRPKDDARPDIGALPLGSEPLRVGVDGRTAAGASR